MNRQTTNKTTKAIMAPPFKIFPKVFPMGLFSSCIEDGTRKSLFGRKSTLCDTTDTPSMSERKMLETEPTQTESKASRSSPSPDNKVVNEPPNSQHLSQRDLDDVLNCFNRPQHKKIVTQREERSFVSSGGSLISATAKQPKPSSWDPSSLLHHDPSAFEKIRKLRDLANIFEATRHADGFQEQYRQIQKDLTTSSNKIHRAYASAQEKRHKLDNLYRRTSQCMRELIHLAETPKEVSDKSWSDYYAHHIPEYDLIFQIALNRVKNEPPDNHSNQSLQDQRRALKVMFHQTRFELYMREWLHKNWSSPFPNRQDLDIISSATKVSELELIVGWLQHVRHTQWKPAQTKAFELGRPSSLYEQDSFAIYCGKRTLSPLPRGTKMNKRPPLHPNPRKVPQLHVINTWKHID